jgi:hypothetical protein
MASSVSVVRPLVATRELRSTLENARRESSENAVRRFARRSSTSTCPPRTVSSVTSRSIGVERRARFEAARLSKFERPSAITT